MIKVIFNFKYIHTYAQVTYYFFNNLTIYLYSFDKNVFNFKYIHASVWLHARKNYGKS